MSDKKNIHQRLAEAMRAVSYIQREEKKGMQYRIVSHDAVTAKVRPALLDAGIVYYPVRCDHMHNGNRAECGMTVRFVNVDEPTDFFEVPTFGYGIDPQDKGPGKAMSYAVKYALLKALGLETGDDPEQESIPHRVVDPAEVPAHANPTSEALGQAWEDGVLDGLPENPSPRDKAVAFCDAICRDFATKKGKKALENDWSRRERYILKFKEVYPDLHERVVDAYEMKSNELSEGVAA